MSISNQNTAMTKRDWLTAFDEYLEDNYPKYDMFGLSFLPSDILKEVDPIAYKECFYDWLCAEGWQNEYESALE